jgi:hypothetical protein
MRQIKLVWSTDDVLIKADEMSIDLTELEADTILETLEERHDASIGICWDVIGCYITEFELDRTQKDSFYKSESWAAHLAR